MAQVDLSFAADAATLKDIQTQLAMPGLDPIKKAILEVQEAQLTSQVVAKANQASQQIQATNSFIDNFALQQTLSNVFATAGQSLPTILAIFKK